MSTGDFTILTFGILKIPRFANLANSNFVRRHSSAGAPRAHARARAPRHSSCASQNLKIWKLGNFEIPHYSSGDPRGVTGSIFTMKPEPRRMPAFGLHREVRAGHAEWSVHYSSGEPRGVTGSNFEMKPERRRMPGFGLHFEVRACHAEWSVQVPQGPKICHDTVRVYKSR